MLLSIYFSDVAKAFFLQFFFNKIKFFEFKFLSKLFHNLTLQYLIFFVQKSYIRDVVKN